MKTVLVSGYFSTLTNGHLDLIEAAAKLGDRLVVIVNNDTQQMLKKGEIVMDEKSRMRRMKALRAVDNVILSIDTDMTVIRTIDMIATTSEYAHDTLILAQGGVRSSDKLTPEAKISEEHHIERVYNVGA